MALKYGFCYHSITLVSFCFHNAFSMSVSVTYWICYPSLHISFNHLCCFSTVDFHLTEEFDLSLLKKTHEMFALVTFQRK